MDRTRIVRIGPRVSLAAIASLIAFAAPVAEAQTQDSGPYGVLVPAFQPKPGARGNFGKDVAKEFNKLLESFATHQPIEQSELRAALRKYQIKEDDLGPNDCVFGQQLALQMHVPLVLCGTFEGAEGAFTINASVKSTEVQETYVMDPITAINAKEAAQKLATEFQDFVENLKIEVFCSDYVGNQNWAGAIENCTKVVQNNPMSKRANFNLAYAYYSTEQYEQSKEYLRKLIQMDPLNQDALHRMGVIYARQDSTEKAMQYFKEYLQLNPGDVGIRMTIAADAAEAGGPEASLRVLEDGLSAAQGEDLLQLQEFAGGYAMNAALKMLQQNRGQLDDSSRSVLTRGVSYLEKVQQAKADSTDVVVIRNLLTAYRLLDRSQDAVTLGATATTKANYASDAGVWSAYADALNGVGNTQEALNALDKVAQLDQSYKVYARKVAWVIPSGDLELIRTTIQQGSSAGEIDDQASDVYARQIAYEGYKKYNEGQRQASTPFYDVADAIAKTDATRGMVAFFRGIGIYQSAVAIDKAETFESGCQALPMFQRVQSLMRTAAAYSAEDPRIEPNRKSMADGSVVYIERQNLIIKAKGRGKTC
jgi:tetratricopeptide (TPR) repeat protein